MLRRQLRVRLRLQVRQRLRRVSLACPFPSVPFLPLGVRSDLMMNLRAYGFADLPFVALFPSDLC